MTVWQAVAKAGQARETAGVRVDGVRQGRYVNLLPLERPKQGIGGA